MIEEASQLIDDALSRSPIGEYQLQAAIAALHAQALEPSDTDWAQIEMLYSLLERVSRNPVVTLNRAVAVAMTLGPDAALTLLDQIADDPRINRSHRYHSVRAHVLEKKGDIQTAVNEYRQAARITTNLPERRYLDSQAARLLHNS